MRMVEGENIVQYCTRVKEVVNVIQGAIRVSTIQELRCTLGKYLTIEGVSGRLTYFQMSNFDNYTPATIESTFKSQLILRKRKDKYVKINSDSSNYEIDELENPYCKKIGKARGKYKGKLHIICFSCNKVCHIVAKCPDKEDKDKRKERKYKGRRDEKDYKRNKDEKGKKSCYIAEKETDNESESNDDEVVYVSIKEDSN